VGEGRGDSSPQGRRPPPCVVPPSNLYILEVLNTFEHTSLGASSSSLFLVLVGHSRSIRARPRTSNPRN
jgi:hypothetical protein